MVSGKVDFWPPKAILTATWEPRFLKVPGHGACVVLGAEELFPDFLCKNTPRDPKMSPESHFDRFRGRKSFPDFFDFEVTQVLHKAAAVHTG